MIAESKNEHGGVFQLFDDTEFVFTEGHAQSVYHFINRGTSGILRDYVDCHHLMNAVVMAPSYNDAIKLVTDEHLGNYAKDYVFEVHYIGADMMPSQGPRILTFATKPPLE